MSGETFTIRAAQEDELPDVLRLWREAGVTPPGVTDCIEGLTRLMRAPTAVLFIAAMENRLVGSVIGGWDGWRGNIYRLAVLPEFRRKRIARRLVEEISCALFDMGAQRLCALVEHEHPWAMRFWDSMRGIGYERDPRFARYIRDRDAGTPR